MENPSTQARCTPCSANPRTVKPRMEKPFRLAGSGPPQWVLRIVLLSRSGGVCRAHPDSVALLAFALEDDGPPFPWLSHQRDAPARDGQGIQIALLAFPIGAGQDLDAIAGRRARQRGANRAAFVNDDGACGGRQGASQ